MEVTIERLFAATPDGEELVAELDQVLGALYDPEQRHGLSIEQVFQPNVRFFVARLGEEAVGCGLMNGAVSVAEGSVERPSWVSLFRSARRKAKRLVSGGLSETS